MKLFYSHENPFFVGNARNLLENAGIEVMTKNEFSSSGSGELAPMDTWPELWVVNEKDYTAAQAIIDEIKSPSDKPPWFCSNCGEENDASFEFCWQCQTERRVL